MKMYFILLSKFRSLLIASLLMWLGCTSEDENSEPIARVYDAALSMEEAQAALGPDASVEELKQYAEDWVRKEGIAQVAKRKFKGNISDIRQKLHEYENSLYIYAYEQQEVDRLLDTTVIEEEMKAYYERNSNDFVLDDFLVQVFFVKLPKEEKIANDMWALAFRTDSLSLLNAKEKAAAFGDPLIYNPDSWIYFNEIVRMLPPESIYSRSGFVARKAKQRFEDQTHVYYLNVLDYRTGISPFDFEKPNIRDRILQSRIMELRKQIRINAANEAYEGKNVEILL